MGKLWRCAPSLLLGLLSAHLSSCQPTTSGQPPAAQALPDKCSSRQYQDSLVSRYIEHGAQRFSYLDPRWTQYCDSLIAVCPNIAVAYREKAIPLIKDGKFEEAFALEDKAVALNPKQWLAYRGFLKCIFAKDYEGAILDFQAAARLTPNGLEMDHTYPFFEGLCNLELGRYAQAEASFKQDMQQQRGPDGQRDIHFNTLFYVGVLYYEMKQYEAAATYLGRCLSTYSQHPDANYYLALVSRARGNEPLARLHLELAQQVLRKGYTMNEDNLYYSNYPHQITAYEVATALAPAPR
ncbi:tetratricopeptide repeat protein [Hymenobacter sediminicola]|uniref:Tetratricopeptide repeat protein n=1 Tax=Hymenobacter sediminicola TaxID=2761579 RepID=A0A7G7W4M2_9BACT|nr:tetratricopeptide repeat protein [Hymenobacter sediminicola]QNH61315.1 tetratricopeptide repeat protein [Hymenobacter sediminicola]